MAEVHPPYFPAPESRNQSSDVLPLQSASNPTGGNKIIGESPKIEASDSELPDFPAAVLASELTRQLIQLPLLTETTNPKLLELASTQLQVNHPEQKVSNLMAYGQDIEMITTDSEGRVYLTFGN